MKKKKYLPLYYEWMETGRLPHNGLCYSVKPGIGFDKTLLLFEPASDISENMVANAYWAHGANKTTRRNADDFRYAFTSLRQTILLFMAAMNNEL